MPQTQWIVEAAGDAGPLTITMQVSQVIVATENGDQITVAAEQVEPLVNRLDRISYYLAHGSN